MLLSEEVSSGDDGPGCAFLDYDGDGYPDILLVNGEDWPGHKRVASTLKLYHNNHDGTFTDVTVKAGLAVALSAWVWRWAITITTA